MSGLDTNVLVRWLVADDETQLEHVAALFRSTASRDATLFVPTTVVLELEWVLRSRYGFGKGAVLQALNALLEVRELEFESEPALERALQLFRESQAEFSDCLHVGLCGAAGQPPLLTFDVKAARLSGAKLLGH
jgi:predicted nucleic-acid-binding protein